MYRAVVILGLAVHLFSTACQAETTLRPSETIDVGGVVRNLMVLGEPGDSRVVCCTVREGRTKLSVWQVGKSEPPEVKYEDEVQHISFDASATIGVLVSLKGGVTLVDMKTWKRLARYDNHEVKVACVDAKSNSVLVGYESTKVGRLDMETGAVQQLPNSILTNPVQGMKVADDGSHLLIGCDEGEVVSYNLREQTQVLVSQAVRSGEPSDRVYCFSTFESSDHLMWARFGGTVYAKTSASEQPRMVAEKNGFAHAMVRVPQLNAVAISSGHNIRILRTDGGKLVATCEGEGSMMWTIAIAGSKLFGGTWRGNLLVWNLDDLK